MIAAGGHEIGNHSYSHPKMESLGTAQAREEIVKANEVIEATTGKSLSGSARLAGDFGKRQLKSPTA